MSIEEKIFEKKVPNFQQLLAYGFKKENDKYFYQTMIMDNQFKVKITVTQSGQVKGQVIDSETDEEYVLIHVNNRGGNFLGQVREEYQQVLTKIAGQCFTQVPFHSKQANKLAQFIKSRFNEKVDFPFKKFPDYGVFRNHVNNKWYGLIMNISKDRLTKDKKDQNIKIEILDLKIPKANHDLLLKNSGFYPSYHMHKQSWITIILDDEVETSRIMQLIKKSRELSIGKIVNSSWLIPANPKYYDIDANFVVGKTTIWKQSTNIQVGDWVYLYVTAPVKAVRFKCKVIKTNIPYQYQDKDVRMKKVMKVKVLKEYEADFCTFSKLKDFNIKAIRGPRRVPERLDNYLNGEYKC